LQFNYWYNALEQRVRKSGDASVIASGAAHYVYDEDGRVLGEYDSADVPLYEVIWMGDQPVAVVKQTRTGNGATLNVATRIDYIYADHLNTPRIIVRSSDHAMVWRWDGAEPFGYILATENPKALGIYSFNLRFPGQVFDRETAGHYNLHRDYDPWLGRFVQSDPIGLAGGINTYSYALNQPTKYTDPDGRIVPAIAAACAANPAACAAAEVGTAIAVQTAANGAWDWWINRKLGPSWPSWPPKDPPGYRSCPPNGDSDPCYEQCKHLLPSPSGDLQASEYRAC
jgi:RHS repeat-associated protein